MWCIYIYMYMHVCTHASIKTLGRGPAAGNCHRLSACVRDEGVDSPHSRIPDRIAIFSDGGLLGGPSKGVPSCGVMAVCWWWVGNAPS